MDQDRIEIFLDGQWFGWQRFDPKGRKVAVCGNPYDSLEDCLNDVIRVNGRPFFVDLVTDADSEPAQTMGQITHQGKGTPAEVHLPGSQERQLREPTFGMPGFRVTNYP